MGMNMAGEHCPNCGDDLEEGQIGLCDFCTSESDGDTHGSPELDADARKLEAMGQDPGPTLAEIGLIAMGAGAAAGAMQQALKDALEVIDNLSEALAANQQAWEGEEDSVKEEHEELIARNEQLIEACKKFAAKRGQAERSPA